MDAEITAKTGPRLIRPGSTLAGEEAARLKEDVRAALTAGEDVILDMADVRFTDSEGLSSLVACYKTACGISRRLCLAHVRFNLRALLELTRLHRIFEVYEDIAAAQAALLEESAR